MTIGGIQLVSGIPSHRSFYLRPDNDMIGSEDGVDDVVPPSGAAAGYQGGTVSAGTPVFRMTIRNSGILTKGFIFVQLLMVVDALPTF
jgi:hypothetical protein